MDGPCKDCPDLATCVSPCPKLLKEIPPPIEDELKHGPEIPASGFITPKYDEYEGKEKETVGDVIDRYRPPDITAKYRDESDLNAEYYQEWMEAEELSASDDELLKSKISSATSNPKLREMFGAFLGCASMVNIARAANVSKQYIHKEFAKICQRAARELIGGEPSKKIYTPHQVKKRYRDRIQAGQVCG